MHHHLHTGKTIFEMRDLALLISIKACWRFMLTCSRLKSGAKNVRILESIFILNNILNKLRDNSSNIDEYIDPEDDVNIGVLSILDENIQSRSHNTCKNQSLY